MKRMITISILFISSIMILSQNSGWITLNTVPVSSTLNDIFALNSQTAIAIGNNGIIIKTTNGGDTWMALQVTSGANLYSIYFVNSQIGWIAGNDRTILKTTNGGESWFQQFSTMSNRHAKDIFFINENTGWFVCRDDWFTSVAIVYSTNDGGNSWSSHLTGSSWNYNSIIFINANQGLIVGGGGNIFKSNDGGSSWVEKTSNTSKNLNSIISLTNQTFFVAGNDGTILKSNDIGETWNKINLDNYDLLKFVYFENDLTGWIVGDDGLILKSTNGGQDWGIQLSNTTNDLYSVSFSDELNGWAVGTDGSILKTNDGGGEILPLPSISERIINPNGGFEEASLGQKTGFEVTGWEFFVSSPASALFEIVDNPTYEGNRSLKVTVENVGSQDWHIQAVNYPFDVQPNTEYTYSIMVKANKYGPRLHFTVGDPSYNEWGRINQLTITTDWQLVTFKFTTPNNATEGRAPIHFSLFLSSGYEPIIFYLDDLKILKPAGLVDVNADDKIDHSYSLLQNYPNPFNPSTTIKFIVGKPGWTKLKIYDLLGKEIKTILDQELTSGQYSINFDGTSLTSGIYFYQLISGDFCQTKKFVLLK